MRGARTPLRQPKAIEQLLTINETAELLRITRGTVYYLIRTGQLTTVRVGKHQRIEPSVIRAMLDRSKEEA